MGSAGPGGTQQTVDKGIRALNPTAVICIGIAFGVNEKRQSIGDILIAKQLRLYDLMRVGKDRIILRGDKPHASTRLINFFEGVANTSWDGAHATSGVMLTGEKLIDNFDYREQLLQLEPEAIGGEMEGAGVYVASNDAKIDLIVVKAICDWGDGTKSTNKTSRQKKAARSAAEFILHALKQAPLTSASSYGTRPFTSNRAETGDVIPKALQEARSYKAQLQRFIIAGASIVNRRVKEEDDFEKYNDEANKWVGDTAVWIMEHLGDKAQAQFLNRTGRRNFLGPERAVINIDHLNIILNFQKYLQNLETLISENLSRS
jgi:nucleoside phosphorylase